MSDIKEDIIEVASENMQRVGIRSLSIDDICKLLGISKKTFYVHFATKEDLLDTLLKHQQAAVCDKVEHMIETQTVEQILSACLTIVHRTKQIMQPPVFIYDLKKYYPQCFEAYKQRMQRYTRLFVARFLEKGISEGFFRTDLNVVLTSNFIARLHMELLNTLSDSNPEHERELADEARYGFGLMVRGIITEEGGKRIKALSEQMDRTDENEQ